MYEHDSKSRAFFIVLNAECERGNEEEGDEEGGNEKTEDHEGLPHRRYVKPKCT
jgi:hypothetical protein